MRFLWNENSWSVRAAEPPFTTLRMHIHRSMFVFRIIRLHFIQNKSACLFISSVIYLTFGSCAVVVPMLQSIFSMSEDILPLIMSFCCIFVLIALRNAFDSWQQAAFHLLYFIFTSMFRAPFMDTPLVELLLRLYYYYFRYSRLMLETVNCWCHG